MDQMTGIIPAAGKGTRLGLPYPKELLPIALYEDRMLTVLESNILQMTSAGITNITIVLRPEKDIIRRYLGDFAWGADLFYVYQETNLTTEGLPDAVRAAHTRSDLCVMLMGDVYFTEPGVVSKLVQAMNVRKNAVVGVGTWITDQPQRFGIVDSEAGWVKSIVDKPDLTGWRDMWGCVAFRYGFWPYVFTETQTLSRAMDRMARRGPVLSVQMPGQYLDLGTPQSYLGGVSLVQGLSA